MKKILAAFVLFLFASTARADQYLIRNNSAAVATATTTLALTASNTNYIQNRPTLQSGAMFFVSSGTAVNLYRDGKLVAIADDVSGSTNAAFSSISAIQNSYVSTTNLSGITLSTVAAANLSTNTYRTGQHFMNYALSPGSAEGGFISIVGSSYVSVAGGSGTIKRLDSNSPSENVLFMNWSSSSNIPIPSTSVRYIGISYNGGSPVVSVQTSFNWDLDTSFPLGTAVSDGATTYVSNTPWHTSDALANVIERFDSIATVARDNRVSGLTLGSTGTRNVTVSAGALLSRLEEYSVSAFDSSGVGTFDSYYRNGSGGWSKLSGQTQWNNSQYDNNSGTLQSASLLNYVSSWFYLMTDGSIAMIYGQNQYSALAALLQGDTAPASVPSRINEMGILIGRIVAQQGSNTAVSVMSAFSTQFAGTVVSNHNDLANIQGGTSGEYYHFTNNKYLELSTATAYILQGNATPYLNISGSTQTKTGGLILGGAISASSASFVSVGATTASFVLVTLATGLPNPAYRQGLGFYDSTEKTWAYYNDEPDVTMNIGQELWRRVYNNSGATILNGDLVYQNGIAAGLPSVDLAIASDVFKADVLGFATHDIENNTSGYVTIAGTVHGLNTASVAVSSGNALYLSAFTLGKSTQTRPSQPFFTVQVGKVEMIGSADGETGASIGTKMGGAITVNRIPFGTSTGFSSESSSLTFTSTASIPTLTVLGNVVASSANFTNLFSNGSQVLDVSGSTQTKTGGLNLSGALEFLGVPYFRVDPNGNIRLGRGQGAFSGSRLMVLTDNGATLGGTGSDYLILGPQSLDSTSLNGQYCTFGGTGQMSGPSTGTYNMFWSNQGGNLRMGSGNSFFGSQINNGYSVDGPVGNSNNHMTNCTIIGNLAGGSKTGHDLSDSIAIGAGSLVGDSYTAVIGTPRTKVVIGTDIASSKFDVVDGSITVRGANSNIIATSMTATIFLTTSAAPATSQVVVYARNTRAVTTNVLSSVTLTDVTRGSQFVTGSTPTVVKIPWTGWYQIIAGGFRCGQGDGTVEMIGWTNAALTVRERAVVSDVDCTTFYKTFTKYLAAGTTSIYRVNENTSTVVIPEISTTVKVTADFTMIYHPQIPW